jgi:hypothetical protein
MRYVYKRMQEVFWKEWGKYGSVNFLLFEFRCHNFWRRFSEPGERGGGGQYSRQMVTGELEYNNEI